MTSNDASRKRALLTGGTGAIGRAIAEGLVTRGFDLVLAVRSLEKGDTTAAAIERVTGRAPRVVRCELSLGESIRALADTEQGPLHVLINNAAECPRQRRETPEGVELQFATNVLAYYRMMTAFTPHLTAAAPSRIVNVASYWAGGLDLGDLEFKKRRYDNDTAYRQSKQADRMISSAFAERLKDRGVAVNACHPGDVRSRLSSDLGFGGHESPAQGAATPLMLAVDDIGEKKTGGYFAHMREERCHFSTDRAAVGALFDICGSYD